MTQYLQTHGPKQVDVPSHIHRFYGPPASLPPTLFPYRILHFMDKGAQLRIAGGCVRAKHFMRCYSLDLMSWREREGRFPSPSARHYFPSTNLTHRPSCLLLIFTFSVAEQCCELLRVGKQGKYGDHTLQIIGTLRHMSRSQVVVGSKTR
jgi:hypothetical protein